MSVDRRTATLGAAVLTMGLLAGVFYAFACAVIPGLADADDRTLIDAMQQINDAIENPVFFASFLGAPALAIAALVMERRAGAGEVVRWIAAALALYAVALVVTGALNIPLNDDLADAGDPATIGDPAAVRDDFLGPWVGWNIVRTVASAGSFACLAYALWLSGRSARERTR
jgi:uncharacterized membrane protein